MSTAILLAVLMLPSCFAGIGDGALVGGGGYSPIKPNDRVDTTDAVEDITASVEIVGEETSTNPSAITQLGAIKKCSISLIVGNSINKVRYLSGDNATAVYGLFYESNVEYMDSSSVSNTRNCIKVYFADDAGNCETFYVQYNDVFSKDDASTSDCIGKIDDLYSTLKWFLQ